MNVRSLALALLAIALASCSSKPTLIGEWIGNLTLQGVTVDMSFAFKADGTLAVTQTANGQGSTQKGTYKEEEKSFTMTPTSVESAAIPKATLDQLNADLAKNSKPITFTLEWKDADTIAVTQQGAPAPVNVPITLRRKK